MNVPNAALLLFEDPIASTWSPFAETRPVGELRFGAWTLRERALRATGAISADYVGAQALDGFEEPDAGRPVDEAPTVAPEGGLRIWLSRAVPALNVRMEGPVTEPASVLTDGEVVALEFPGGAPIPPPREISARFADAAVSAAPTREIEAALLEGPWDLVSENADRLREDLLALGAFADTGLPDGVHLVGPKHLSTGSGVAIGPGVILDTRDGPIRLDDGCVVEGPARLVGPLHLGPGCIVFGGPIARVSAGPVCKLRGEIADVVICGYTNKAHDGYLGHALVGRWVNLGAGTTNSDLKNNYSGVRITTGSGSWDTGRTKVGVFLGDHVKTGIGTLLNTGTAIGAASNVFGGGMPPKWVPPFSWSWPKGNRPFRFDRFEEVARIVTARRGQAWPTGMNELYRRLHDDTYGPTSDRSDIGA